MGTAFMLIPNISAYIQYNLNYAREDLIWLYLAGGAVSFLASQFAGYAIDRWSTLTVTLISSCISLFSIYNGFVIHPIEFPVIIIFTLYMTGNAMSAVARTSCVSHIPTAEERAGFMLLFGAMRCVGITLGSFFSTFMLQTSITGKLSGMSELATIAMVLSLVFPIAVWQLERQLTKEGATSC